MSVTHPTSERVPGLASALRRLAAFVAVLIAVATILVATNRNDEPTAAPATASEVATDRARLADAARWQGLADYYLDRPVPGTPDTVGGAPITPSAPADAGAARTEIWDFKDGLDEPLGASTPAGSTVDAWSYTPFIERMLGIGAPPVAAVPDASEDAVGSTAGDIPCTPSSFIC